VLHQTNMFTKLKFRKIFGIKIPLIVTLPILLLSIGIGFYPDIFGLNREKVMSENFRTPSNEFPVAQNTHKLKLPDGHLVYPILFDEQGENAANYSQMKSSLNSVINNYQLNQSLLDAAIYFYDFSSFEWFGINADQRFTPGSLMKIATAITVMNLAETNPEILNRRITFTERDNLKVNQTLTYETLNAGQSYTVNDLLSRMLRHSDNHATFLLNKQCGIEALRKTYNDFGITMPHDANYQITIHQYVRFLKALFFSTYLNENNSAYLLELLSQSSFKYGLVNNQANQSNLKIAHKFGERDYNGIFELHDVGIVYKNGNAYLLGVMAKGKSRVDLENFIGQISITTTSGI
jgi:beta-lactamase class A